MAGYRTSKRYTHYTSTADTHTHTHTHHSWLTHCQLLPPGIRLPRLGFQDQSASRSQVAIDLTEEVANTIITPVEMNPLGKGETEDDIILRLYCFQLNFVTRYVVPLRKTRTINKLSRIKVCFNTTRSLAS